MIRIRERKPKDHIIPAELLLNGISIGFYLAPTSQFFPNLIGDAVDAPRVINGSLRDIAERLATHFETVSEASLRDAIDRFAESTTQAISQGNADETRKHATCAARYGRTLLEESAAEITDVDLIRMLKVEAEARKRRRMEA